MGVRRTTLVALMVLVLAACLLPNASLAGWQHDGTEICTSACETLDPNRRIPVISDGFGGAIAAWCDSLSSNRDVRAQRVDAAGVKMWPGNGVVVSASTGPHMTPKAAPDGTGGAIIVWCYDGPTGYDIYAQRVDGSGAPRWTADGVAVCTYSGVQTSPKIAADGAGGAIIAWHDARDDIADVYAQHVDSTGALLWDPNGVPVSVAPGHQWNLQIAPDGAGGAVMCWSDGRRNPGWVCDIYAQRVDASGDSLWGANGMEIHAGDGLWWWPEIASDGAEGAVIAWYGNPYDIYAQRVDSSGVKSWGASVPVCTDAGNQSDPAIVSDGAGGAIVTWADPRDSVAIFGQRVDASGNVRWTPDGISLSGDMGEVCWHGTASDGAGGAVVSWMEWRNAVDWDVYTQRVDSSGTLLWGEGGVAASAAAGDQMCTNLVSDGAGGAIVMWEDHRSGSSCDIYGIRVDRHGHSYQGIAIYSIEDVPNDQGRQVSVSWYRSIYDAPGDTVVITEYSLWRRIDDLPGAVSAGQAPAARARSLLGYPPGDWHYVTSVPARGENVYSCVAPTLCDSTSEGMCLSTFFVSAMTPDPLVYFDSEPDSGYSVDNLAPAAPSNLRMPSLDEIAWDEAQEEDFDYFTVYGSDVAELDETAEIIGYTIETTMDVTEHIYDYYLVTATDFAGNESEASSLEYIPAGVDVPGNLPEAFALRHTGPNPFARETLIGFDLPTACKVSLEVYDAGGRLVKVLSRSPWPPGTHSLAWPGDDEEGNAVAAGVYFVAIKAGEFEDTGKLLIVR